MTKPMEERVLFKLIELGEAIDPDMELLDKIKVVHAWMDENIVTLKQEQSVIKTKFTSEEEDALKYYLAEKLVDELMEDGVEVTVGKNSVATKVIAFNRKT